jgi:FtsH-binding integral membrane protein
MEARMSLRQRLLLGTGLLVVVQVGHLLDVVRFYDDATIAGALANPLGWVGIGVALAAFLAVAADHSSARGMAMLAGLGVGVGFLLYHGIPVDLGANNPYWGTPDANADAIMWASVIALILIGVWTAWAAWAAGRTSADDQAPSSVRG